MKTDYYINFNRVRGNLLIKAIRDWERSFGPGCWESPCTNVADHLIDQVKQYIDFAEAEPILKPVVKS